MTQTATGRIFSAALPEDEWADCIGKFATADSAFNYAHDESVRCGRRMLVLPPRHYARRVWLVYPANTCQRPWSTGWNPGNKRCDQPIGHSGRHECTREDGDGTTLTTYWDDSPSTPSQAQTAAGA